jgi:hypothetical protein
MDREIFEHGGRKYDPFAVRRTLFQASGGALNANVAKYNAGGESDAFYDAEALLVYAARQAFRLADFEDGGGATDKQALDALVAWLWWQDAQKKSTANSPTSAPPSGCRDC